MKTYHVKRYDNGEFSNMAEFDTELGNIREVAMKYGRTSDTLELYDGGKLIAMATWPMGSKMYKYCTGKSVNEDPHFRIWRY